MASAGQARAQAPPRYTYWTVALHRRAFELAVAGELERRIELALSKLSPQYREVVLLVGHEGLTPADAAVVCGMSPEALRQRLSRARAALAEKLQETPAVAALKKGYAT